MIEIKDIRAAVEYAQWRTDELPDFIYEEVDTAKREEFYELMKRVHENTLRTNVHFVNTKQFHKIKTNPDVEFFKGKN